MWYHPLSDRTVNVLFGKLNFIIDAAKENRFERIYLHSQIESIGFYKNLGFIEQGDVFQEAGIDHVLMELKNE